MKCCRFVVEEGDIPFNGPSLHVVHVVDLSTSIAMCDRCGGI